jgi:hypothetical protein
MVGILVMLNNYLHDFATALVVVSTCGMLLLIRYSEGRGGKDLKKMLVELYPKMVHLAGGAVVFVFVAGIVRAFTYKEFEWYSAVASGQVTALMIKHVILFTLFAYGIYIWVAVHKRIMKIKKELS